MEARPRLGCKAINAPIARLRGWKSKVDGAKVDIQGNQDNTV